MAKKPAIEKPKNPETEEEWIDWCLANFITNRHTRVEKLSEPSYLFFPGEQVEIGNLKDCEVVATAFDGRVIVMKCRDVGERQGQPFDNGWKYGAWPWTRVVPKSTQIATELAVPNWMHSFSQMPLESLMSRSWQSGYVDNPDYQRDYVWELGDKVALLESILAGFPIGSFLFHARPDYQYEVIDGKQRLNALLGFRNSEWEYQGLSWNNLSRLDRHYIEMRLVQVCDMPKESTRLDKLRMFLACNHSGVPQTSAHIERVHQLYIEELKAQTPVAD